MTKLSVVINTINEEKNIKRAIQSVQEIADEVIVVDMHSEDDTVKIAKRLGATIYTHKQEGYVEPARNFAIKKATGKWILILDADEEVSRQLSAKLKKIVKNPIGDYYRIPRKNIIFGKWIKHSRWWPDYNIRLFKKGFVTWNEVIHSVPMTKGKGVDLKARENLALIHYHYNTVEEYIQRLNRYTTHHAKLKQKEGYVFSWQDLIVKPTAEFLSRYFQGQGYKDGLHGLALANLQAFSELVLFLKLWQEDKFKTNSLTVKNVIGEMKTMTKEVNYWQADTLFSLGGGIVQQIKRKFKLP
jgi:(heptosyl)LPS beta-1,4-glucosyltransferase